MRLYRHQFQNERGEKCVLVYKQATMKETLDFYDDLENNEAKAIQKEMKKCMEVMEVGYSKRNPFGRYKKHLWYREIVGNQYNIIKEIVKNRHRRHKSIYKSGGGDEKAKHIPDFVIKTMICKEANVPFHLMEECMTIEDYDKLVDSIIRNLNQQTLEGQKTNKEALARVRNEENKEYLKKKTDHLREIMKQKQEGKLKVVSEQFIT